MQQALDLPVTPRYSFENFVCCNGNATALAFARQLAQPDGHEKLLVLYGPTGCGKSHLLHAIQRTIGGGGQGYWQTGAVETVEQFPEHLAQNRRIRQQVQVVHQQRRQAAQLFKQDAAVAVCKLFTRCHPAAASDGLLYGVQQV
jgi:chromosomal replication initiation ATPase DnaA